MRIFDLFSKKRKLPEEKKQENEIKKNVTVTLEKKEENVLPICPNCGNSLPKFPQARSKCKKCGNFYWAKKDPRDGVMKIVNSEIAKEFEEIYFKIRNEKLEIEWLELNSKVIKLRKQSDPDWKELATIYRTLAHHEKRKDITSEELVEESFRCELRNYKKNGTKRVEILASDDSCSICKALNKKVYTVDQALEKMPLPVKNPDDPSHICRCCYLPVVR
jgi:ribosomal protein S27AE